MNAAARDRSDGGVLAASDRYLGANLNATEERIRDFLGGDAPFITELLEYAGAAGGKRLRPRLAMLATASCGNDPARVVDVAAAIELIHLATLLHDDVIDEAPTRRGRPAPHRRFGNRLTILGGDYLITRVFQTLVTKVKDWDIFEVVLSAANKMVAGEFFEIWWQNRMDLKDDDYFHVITLKSAKLLEAACRAGAIAARSSVDVAKRLGDYGLNAGLAFQITDDWLDFTAGSDVLGKEAFADICAGKITLPVIYGLGTARGGDVAAAVEAIWEGSPDQAALAALLHETGALDMTLAAARRYAEQSKEALAGVSPGEPRDLLAALADWTWQREY